MASTARAHLESLLRDRQLDVTLTSSALWATDDDDLAPTGIAAVDAALDGGLRRGHLSELVGARSSGRTSMLCRVMAEAIARGELVALVDPCDRFDPASAAAMGVDLSQLLWIRDAGDAARALKAMNLVVQAGGFGLVAFDLSDVRPLLLRQFPSTTWMRIARVIEGSPTVALLVGSDRLARSARGVTISCEPGRPRWAGAGDRARVLHAVDVSPRVVRATLAR